MINLEKHIKHQTDLYIKAKTSFTNIVRCYEALSIEERLEMVKYMDKVDKDYIKVLSQILIRK